VTNRTSTDKSRQVKQTKTMHEKSPKQRGGTEKEHEPGEYFLKRRTNTPQLQDKGTRATQGMGEITRRAISELRKETFRRQKVSMPQCNPRTLASRRRDLTLLERKEGKQRKGGGDLFEKRKEGSKCGQFKKKRPQLRATVKSEVYEWRAKEKDRRRIEKITSSLPQIQIWKKERTRKPIR